MDRLREAGSELVLTPLALIDRIAALAPPPRTHRRRYVGVLAPNSSLPAAVTAMALAAPPVATVQPKPAKTSQARSRAAQALTGALLVGGVDRPH